MTLQFLWLQQYLLGGFVASFVALYLYTKRAKGNKTWALDAFFSFGLLIALWEFSTFFQRTASTPEISGFFFYIVLISSALSQPTYLITALSIQKEKRYLFLIFVPAIIRIISFLFFDIDFFMGNFGWNYDLSLSGIPLEIGTAIYLGYLIAIIVILIGLVRNARSSVLRKKYLVLLVSFTLFQAIGFTVTNYILAVDHNFPPLGGVLQFMTFIGIGYALNLKESKIPSSIPELTSFPAVCARARMKLELIPPQLDKDEIKEIYNKIESQALYMDKIVTNLQDFSRSIAVNTIKAKIKELIDETISSLSVPDNVTISLNLNNAPMLRFDQPSMKREFYNLILNAFQANPDGGTLTITANATDEEVRITVADTGKGIPKESMSRIFEPFFTTKAQGQGLGLSICKKFVEANGGSIEVESQEGKGTTFKITLPII